MNPLLEKSIADTWDLDQLLDKIEGWWRWMDAGMKKAMAKRPDKISCYDCTHESPGCCHQKIMIPFFEALPIARHLKKQQLDTPTFRACLRELGDAMEGSSRDTWFHDVHPCVFLQGGRCSIYPVRPTACRTYFVINDPADCQPGNHNGIRHIDNGEILQDSLQKALATHKALNLKETPKRILMGTLPRLVLLALEAMDSNDYQALVRAQIWPTDDNLDAGDWLEGKNPFGEKLYQIRKAKEG